MPSTEPFIMDTLSLALTGGVNGYRINLKDMEVNLTICHSSEFIIQNTSSILPGVWRLKFYSQIRYVGRSRIHFNNFVKLIIYLTGCLKVQSHSRQW